MNQAISFILFRYISQRFLISFATIYGGLLGVIYLIDAIEVMRKLAKYDHFTIGRIIKITLFKLPEVGLDLMPFAILIAAVFTFWRLTHHQNWLSSAQLAFQRGNFYLHPFLLRSLLAALKVLVLNPLSAAMIGQYEQMEAQYLSVSGSSTINIARTGLWLRQKMDDGRITIIHAANVQMPIGLYNL